MNFVSGKVAKRLVLIFMCLPFWGLAQSNYTKGWEQINNGELEKAINSFEAAVKNNENKDNALLCLTLLNTTQTDLKGGAKNFMKFYKTSKNPHPAAFAMWFDNSVVGATGAKSDEQLDLLNAMIARLDNPIKRAALYRIYYHHVMSNEFKTAKSFSSRLNALNNWAVLGPFDNVVNSGFDKDLGVLNKPMITDTFESKYGAPVSWFKPSRTSKDGYYFSSSNFYTSNAIIYAQTFVYSDQPQEAVLSFSYSGSLKLWMNDQEVYSESKRRNMELDYVQYKLTLNKGYNRILLQLGDHNESVPNFSVRLLDKNGNLLNLTTSAEYKEYTKSLTNVERLNHFALEYFKNEIAKNKDDLLPKLLLAKCYKRTLETENAEKLYKEILEEHPDNYFAIRDLVSLYSDVYNNTSQNYYYGLLEEKYPHSYDILVNDLDEAFDNKEEKKFKELTTVYLDKYSSKLSEYTLEQKTAFLNEDYATYLRLANEMYQKFPDNYTIMITQYNLLKSHYNNPSKAKKVLTDYLKDHLSYPVIRELASTYLEEENFEKAIKLYRECSDFFDYDIGSLKEITEILTKQSRYAEAMEVSENTLKRVPLDYTVTNDISQLALIMDNEEKALEYYELTNKYYPFSFEINEKIRELKGLTKTIDMLEERKPKDMIKEYEENMKTDLKKPYDIVYESKTRIIYKSTASAKKYEYIIKLNDESAVEDWQSITINTSSNFETYINDLYTIKKTGEKIAAERNDGDVVFLQLEEGDYIYVSYSDFQTNGGKTSKFISDEFSLNTFYPAYYREYNLFVEEGMDLIDSTLTHSGFAPKMESKEGFNLYKWITKNEKNIKDENYRPNYNDIADRLYYSTTAQWDEIVQWYSDLSTHQAEIDYTIDELSKDILKDDKLSDEDKFKIIYDFIINNIQYSSVDFRQSSYIPQRASNTYHSRLGDCKDLSTLFVSLARSAGLKANLVLINTNNSKNTVLLPSLNFNHCIVKIYPEAKDPKFLELTSSSLPYGYLYKYHKNAPILEIPYGDDNKKAELEFLGFNNGYQNIVERTTSMKINKNGSIDISKDVLKTGTRAASMYNGYFNLNEDERINEIKASISNDFNTNISMTGLSFDNLNAREDSITYTYSFNVKKDVLNLGSFKTVKLPFSDVIVKPNIFEEGERKYDFNYPNYEDTDSYVERIEVQLEEGQTFRETPKNIKASFNNNEYELKFTKLSSSKLLVVRSFKSNREMIKAEDFDQFKAFVSKVVEGENTQLLFN